jgi:hypothetical protein
LTLFFFFSDFQKTVHDVSSAFKFVKNGIGHLVADVLPYTVLGNIRAGVFSKVDSGSNVKVHTVDEIAERYERFVKDRQARLAAEAAANQAALRQQAAAAVSEKLTSS